MLGSLHARARGLSPPSNGLHPLQPARVPADLGEKIQPIAKVELTLILTCRCCGTAERTAVAEVVWGVWIFSGES